MVRLEKDKVTLKYIFLKHISCRFVSGHVDLSKNIGTHCSGPNTCEFDCISAKDGDVFIVGGYDWYYTHWHTMESTTLLKDEQGKDYAIFSGDNCVFGRWEGPIWLKNRQI